MIILSAGHLEESRERDQVTSHLKLAVLRNNTIRHKPLKRNVNHQKRPKKTLLKHQRRPQRKIFRKRPKNLHQNFYETPLEKSVPILLKKMAVHPHGRICLGRTRPRKRKSGLNPRKGNHPQKPKQ